MVTALLEYLDLLAVFPEAYVNLILFVTILVEYLHLCNAKLAKLQFSDAHFSKFSLCFLPLFFKKKNCWQNQRSPNQYYLTVRM